MMNIPCSKGNGPNSKSADDAKPPPTAFSIATPAVNTILSMAGDYNENSYMQSSSNYHQEVPTEATDDQTHISGQSSNDSNDATKPSNLVEEKPHLDNSTGPKESDKHDGPANANQSPAPDSETKLTKKKDKGSEKSAKLDVKSKLEKSRQSARECRARKKLRYQYLEDLVCNREKAVVKLREELSMVGLNRLIVIYIYPVLIEF